MKAGMLVRVKHPHPSEGKMGLVLECDDVQYDSVALVQWFNGETYWINVRIFEKLHNRTKNDR